MARIFTGCIYDPHDNKFRISVMSRHKLDCGVIDDPKITLDSYDEWMPELGPPGKIIVPYLNGKTGWGEYEVKYNEFLKRDGVVGVVRELARRATEEDIVLLCKERKGENCHRNVLARDCKIYQPSLEIVRL